MNDQITPAVQEINKTIGNINAMTGGSNPLPTISVAGLAGGANSQPMTPVQPPPTTGPTALSSIIGTAADTYAADLQKEANASQKTADDALTALVKELGVKQGVAELTSKEYADSVDPAKTELRKVNADILAEKNALNQRVAEIKKNSTGMLAGALQGEVDRVTADSLAKQANLAVIQFAKQGAYDSAKEIADRAVAVALEKETNKIDALQLTYEANKDRFTKDEQRAFEAKQDDRRNALAERRDMMTKVYDLAITALENGAPASVARSIQNAKTVDEAVNAAGSWLRTPSTTKATEEDKIGALESLIHSGRPLASGEAVIDTNGFITPVAWNALITQAPSEGISREKFIKNFGYLVYNDPKKGIDPAYKISGAEKKLVAGTE